ncbi:hypothetical protein NCG89_00770 [Spongiibacter taiwanensis]|uniref:hypothetical protein n=1 Tax=Spongiibacter taiwanensis TaxID=1748242 RepID=UPI0020365463|nr:hypothetical protein [Spongiibacter taiwanensis]USA43335.1 hypothetical protein NCG89_00770 [Spongiibacter taiwanensis]
MEVKNYFAFTAENKPIPFCTAYLYEAGTSNLVTGLTDKNGNPIDNPFQANKDGLVQFSAPNGAYDLRFKAGLRDYRIRTTVLDYSPISDAAEQVVEFRDEWLSGSIRKVKTIEELQNAIDSNPLNQNFHLTDVMREGGWVWSTADWSALAEIDTRNALVITRSGEDGSNGALIRQFGALEYRFFGPAGEDEAEDTAAWLSCFEVADHLRRTPVINRVPDSDPLSITDKSWRISETARQFRGNISKNRAGRGLVFEVGCKIRTSVVPALHINSNESPGILEEYTVLGQCCWILDGVHDFTEGVVKLTRLRNFDISNHSICPANEVESGFLFHFDGTYLGTVANCNAAGRNIMLLDTFVDSDTGQQDTVRFVGCANYGIAVGFLRHSDNGRHSLVFESLKCNAGYPEYAGKNVRGKLAAPAAAGDNEVVVTDIDGLVANFSFMVGQNSRAEIVTISPEWDGVNTTIPLSTRLRTEKLLNDPTLFGHFGLHLSSVRMVELDTPHFERGSAGLVVDASCELIRIRNYHNSCRSVVLCRGGGVDYIEMDTGYYQGPYDWGVFYGILCTPECIAAGAPKRLAMRGRHFIAGGNTVNLQKSNYYGDRWTFDCEQIAVATIATADVYEGFGVTVPVEPTNEFIANGESVFLGENAILIVSGDYFPHATQLIGDLTGNISAGDFAGLGGAALSHTIAVKGSDITDIDDGMARSGYRILVDNILRAAMRLDGTFKGDCFNTLKEEEEGGGTINIENGVATTLIPASRLGKGYQARVIVGNSSLYCYGECTVHRYNNITQTAVQSAANNVNVIFSIDASGNLQVTQNTGAPRDIKWSLLNQRKG